MSTNRPQLTKITPALKVLTTAEEVEQLRRDLVTTDFVAYDSETTGLTKNDTVVGVSVCFNISVAYYIVLFRYEDGRLIPVVPIEEVRKLLRQLQHKNVVCHNAVFDCMMAESFFNVRLIDAVHTDTMILAHLLDENRWVGLKELGESIFGEDAKAEQEEMKVSAAANGALLTKGSYEIYKADPMLLGKYGAKDAWLTYRLFHLLSKELRDQKLEKFFYEDESMPMLKTVTYDLNTSGLTVDTNKLLTLKKTLEAECAQAKDFIMTEISSKVSYKYPGTNKKNHFNIGSSSQLAWLLFGEMKLEFGTLTKGGKILCKALGMKIPYFPGAKCAFIDECVRRKGQLYTAKSKVRDPWAYIACDKAVLKKYEADYKWVAKLLEYQKKTKLLSTYVEGIESRVSYGTIYPSFLQHGTTSGRYSSRNPNFQNLPRDDKRVKEFIVARPGKVFVGADYSQLEPRVFAYFSKDEKLLASFRSADDFYSVIGMEVFEKYDCLPVKEGSNDAFGIKYKRLRDISKVIALSSTYGSTAFKLAPTVGRSVDDTQNIIDAYFERFPGVKKFMLESHAQAKTNGFVTNAFGRPRRMPEAKKIDKIYGPLDHEQLPYEVRNILNLAVNHRVQSTAASIVNRAAIAFYKTVRETGINCRIVIQVHDSLVVECDEKDKDIVSLALQVAMEDTVQLAGVSLEAVPKIGRNLAEV